MFTAEIEISDDKIYTDRVYVLLFDGLTPAFKAVAVLPDPPFLLATEVILQLFIDIPPCIFLL